MARLGVRSKVRSGAWAACAAAFQGVFAAVPGQAESPAERIAAQVPAALKVLDAYHAAEPVPADRTLHIIYWTPKDREPAPGYRPRLTRVLKDVQAFYRREMEKLGFGPRSIRLATEKDGLLKIHLVQGERPYADYHRQSGGAIRRECLPTLTAAGIDADKETLVIFCNMSNWDPVAGTMSQNSPYYAGGGIRGGNAWQVDSPLLDPDSIAKREPVFRDGEYGKISLGKYNSIFVGGVCHELGHALGLPHNRERPDEKIFGTALMGSGNRTYGENLRGEGKGSFLTLAEALRLASHPMFTGSAKGIDLPANARLDEIEILPAEDRKSFVLKGKITADPPPYAVVGYMDPAGGNDYDATTATAVPDADGRFVLRCDALRPGKRATLRAVVCQANGGRIGDRTWSLGYEVDADGRVDLSTYFIEQRLTKLVAAVRENESRQAADEVESLARTAAKDGSDEALLEIARTLAGSLAARPGPAPAAADGTTCRLADAAAREYRVGWGKPTVNRLPGDAPLIRVGGRIAPRGLYAHAPSRIAYDLGGKWTTVVGKAGLADGHNGSVVFVIRGDGRELWRSKQVTDEDVPDFRVDVTDVKMLELVVEDAGDGSGSDWGVWVDPQVERGAPAGTANS